MRRKILYIQPVRTDEVTWTVDLLRFLEREKQESVDVRVVPLTRGPTHLRYRYYEALVLVDILNLVREAEAKGFDAVIIGCFFDSGLQDAREVAHHTAVVGPCEASVQIASTLCDRFSIIVGSRKGIAQMMHNIRYYGMEKRLASFKPVDLAVLEFRQDKQETMRRLRVAGHEAVECDGAEAIILGCTAAHGFWRELQSELGVPVIDPVIAALKYAEFASELASRYGWSQSKIGAYESPPEDEITRWNLSEQYDFGDIATWLRETPEDQTTL